MDRSFAEEDRLVAALRWRVAAHDAARIASLERAARVSPLVAQILLARKISSPDDVRAFLEPKMADLREPESIPGIPQAVERIARSVDAGERIAVYGDYDADGMTATAILFACLRKLGADVRYHVPSRLDDGYGLNSDAIEKLAAKGVCLIVTVDCGINSLAEARRAKELGVGLVVTDHHEPGAELPDVDAIVHPRLPGADPAVAHLCGAAVAFKLCWALCQERSKAPKVSPELRIHLLQALGMAALGTISDCMPLLGENRTLVRHGLTSLKHHPSVGLQALMQVTKLCDKSSLQSEDVAFMLAPRLNAAGRLGQALLGVELLSTESTDRAAELASCLDDFNRQRETLERRVHLSATKQLKASFDPENDPAIVLADPEWHPGVIGIVAAKLAEKYGRPALLIALDPLGVKAGQGSGRTVPGVALHQALLACTEHLAGHGGHAAAAGFQIRESSVDAFRQAFFEYVAGCRDGSGSCGDLEVEVEACLAQLDVATIRAIDSLAPFGEGNPRPLFCSRGVQLAEDPRLIGKGENHLSALLVQDGVRQRAIAFGKADWLQPLKEAGEFSIVYRPSLNEFRGRVTVDLHLVDWRVETPSPAVAAAQS